MALPVKKKKQKILTVLLLILAASIGYRVTHPFKQQRVEELTFKGDKNIRRIVKTPNTKSDSPAGTPDIVMLNLLENPPRHSGKITHNIFFPKLSVHENDTAAPKPSNEIKPLQNNQGGGIDTLQKHAPELSGCNVFGMYETENDKVVFIERGKDILALREGDIIDGKFLVEQINEQGLRLTSTQSDKPIIINMDELENN